RTNATSSLRSIDGPGLIVPPPSLLWNWVNMWYEFVNTDNKELHMKIFYYSKQREARQVRQGVQVKELVPSRHYKLLMGTTDNTGYTHPKEDPNNIVVLTARTMWKPRIVDAFRAESEKSGNHDVVWSCIAVDEFHDSKKVTSHQRVQQPASHSRRLYD
ncbi:hypothetical protein LTR16_008697, partial [Cryomyces antarcticus]